MVMSWIYVFILFVSILSAALHGNMQSLSAGILEGAEKGITLSLSLAGSICLWTGVGALMDKAGMTLILSKFLSPLLRLIFPSAKKDSILSQHLSANICANFLGLGNAATPMGIQAAKRLAAHRQSTVASGELCRLVVLNTASIQLIPANVAAVRASLGAAAPFDILPAVWITSFCSAGLGLVVAFLMGKVWRNV